MKGNVVFSEHGPYNKNRKGPKIKSGGIPQLKGLITRPVYQK